MKLLTCSSAQSSFDHPVGNALTDAAAAKEWRVRASCDIRDCFLGTLLALLREGGGGESGGRNTALKELRQHAKECDNQTGISSAQMTQQSTSSSILELEPKILN